MHTEEQVAAWAPPQSQAQLVTSVFGIFLETIEASASVCVETILNSASIVLHFAFFA